MRRLKEESGYTLFLTVLTIFIFSILVISLLTMTISGTKRSEVREDFTQASELAEKALNYLTQQINYDLQKEVDKYKDRDGMKESLFIEKVKEVVNRYRCVSEKEPYIVTDTGTFSACVKNVDDERNERLPQQIKIRTVGESEDKRKTYVAVMEFDGNTIKDLDFAVNTFIKESCVNSRNDCTLGEGNLFLHGGSEIQGDISVNRHLITSNRSHEKYTKHHWIHSYFPSIKPKYVDPLNDENNIPSQIIVGGDIYTVEWFNLPGTVVNDLDYPTHVAQIDIPNEKPYEKKDFINDEVFVGQYVPKLSNRTDHPGYNELNVKGKVEDKEKEYRAKYQFRIDSPDVKIIDANIFETGGVDWVLYNEQHPNDKVIPKWYNYFNGTFNIRGNSKFKQFSTYGNVQLGNVRKNNQIEFTNGAYIEGDLVIGNDVEVSGPIYVNGDLKITGKDIVIHSPIYVNGEVSIAGKDVILNNVIYTDQNLNISGKRLTLNTVFYVKGMVHIKHATYDATIIDEIKGDHIIYADKKIVIERTNRFNDQPNELYAYFYSNESIEMDGNESNLFIHGGLSAPRIVLNSIRGRAYAGANLFKQTEPQIVEARAYEGWKEQAKRNSRLRIKFDSYIFEKYSHLLLEKRVTKVVPPQLVDMKEE